MSAANFFNKVRSAFRRRPGDLDLNDTTPIDFSNDLVEDEPPRFNHLKVVVSGETSGYSVRSPSNGLAVSTLVVTDDDDSLIESSSVGSSSGVNGHPCDNCTKRKEMLKNKKVMKRLAIAAILYLVFMTAEIIGKYAEFTISITFVHCYHDNMSLWYRFKPFDLRIRIIHLNRTSKDRFQSTLNDTLRSTKSVK